MRFLKWIFLSIVSLTILLIFAGFIFLSSLKPKFVEASDQIFEVRRIMDDPVIDESLHPALLVETEEFGYTNINGPSLIKVPSWIDNPLGKYYLYFAHHKGRHIRLAYADSLTGPWTMSSDNPLSLVDSGFPRNDDEVPSKMNLTKHLSLSEIIAINEVGKSDQKAYESKEKQNIARSKRSTVHIASPDVVIDDDKQEIRMYYHGLLEGKLQLSRMAVSNDGSSFTAKEEVLGLPYMRSFMHQGKYYTLSMPGIIYRSDSPYGSFEARQRWLFDTNIRHFGILKDGNKLHVFYSRVGDSPEGIVYSTIDISADDWDEWVAEESVSIMRPELDWEGADVTAAPSIRGEIGMKVNQLRDPYIFQEEEKLYLLYVGGGEQAIGIVELIKK